MSEINKIMNERKKLHFYKRGKVWLVFVGYNLFSTLSIKSLPLFKLIFKLSFSAFLL